MAAAVAPIDPPCYTETYYATEKSAAAARHSTTRVLRAWQLSSLIDSAELIVTELMANAIQHGAGPIRFSILRVSRGIEISVYDSCLSRRPNERLASLSDEDGRGLLIVNTLASSWGCEKIVGGKRVWAKLLVVSGG